MSCWEALAVKGKWRESLGASLRACEREEGKYQKQEGHKRFQVGDFLS